MGASSMKTMTLALVLLIASITLVAACGDDDSDDATPADAGAVPTSTAAKPDEQDDNEEEHDEDDLVATGREVYLDVGCAQCHGQDAEGSMMAPALAGHTPEQVRRQVRNPVGMMPRFDEDDLSEDDLEALTAYIDSLEGSHGHGFEEGAPESTHLLMLLIALKADDLNETRHHLGHAREFIDNPEIQEQLNEFEGMLDADNMHDAEHMVESMLGDTEADQATMTTLHLEVTVQALRLEDADDARHHLEHALEGDVSAELEATIQGAIDAIEGGDLHEAEELINQALGAPDHDDGA